jgi:hypothetical protein
MIWGVVFLLAAVLIGIPLRVALTGTTAALGMVTCLLVLLGVYARSVAVLTAAVACGLLQELAALMQAGQPPALWSAVLLGSVVYLLLDIGAFAVRFHGVAVETRVWRTQILYRGSTVVLFGLTTLVVACIATFRFARAGYFSWPLFWPFAVASLPCAFLGGMLPLPGPLYRTLVGIVLVFAAYRLFWYEDQGKPRPGAVPLGLALMVGASLGLVGHRASQSAIGSLARHQRRSSLCPYCF